MAPIAFSICLWASTCPALAPPLSQEQNGDSAAVEEERPLVALALEDWPPYFLLDNDGQPVGFAVDVMKAVARRLDRPLRFKVVPHYVDAVAALQSGEAEIIPFMGIAEGRREVFDFTVPFDTFAISVFARADSVSIESFEDLAGRRVGVVQSNLGLELAGGEPGLNEVVFENIRDALFRLLSSEIDGLIYPEPVVLHLARQVGLEGEIKRVGSPVLEVKRAMAVRPGSDPLRSELDAALKDLLATAEYGLIYERWHRDPNSFWTLRKVVFAAGIGLAVLALVGMGARFHALRRMNRILREQEERFRSLATGMVEGVIIIGADETIEYANPSCGEMLGYEVGELVGVRVEELLEDHDPTRTRRWISGAAESCEGRVFQKDGSAKEVEIHAGPYRPGQGSRGALATFFDIEARKRAEEQVRFQARLLDVIGEAVIATDLQGKILFWNRFAEKLFGWNEEEVLGRNILEVNTPTPGVDKAREIMETLRSGVSWTGEFETCRRDGSRFPALVTNAPLWDDAGDLVGIVGVSSDLTQYKAIEAKLREAQRLEAIGRLAGGIAHDFNNILTAIGGYSGLLRECFETGDSAVEDLDEIEKAVTRGARLVHQLLAYSRRQVLRPCTIDLGTLVREMEKMLERLLPENIHLEIEGTDDPWLARVDQSQIEQVILNLVTNARDAMKKGGRLSIKVTNRKVSREERDPETESSFERYVCLEIRDSGEGIAQEDLPHIFEPFFSRKKIGAGTGLGLATVHGIVKQSGGMVEVETRTGETVFRVFLPAA